VSDGSPNLGERTADGEPQRIRGARHDVLNETGHAEVAAAIASRVLEDGIAAASESRGPAASQDTRIVAAGS